MQHFAEPITMPMSVLDRRSLGFMVLAAAAGCSGSDTPGNNVTCGTGTTLDAGVCYATAPSTPYTGDGGAPEGGAQIPATPPTFAGATAVAPASSSSLLVTWDPATDTLTPTEKLRYNVYVANSAGAQNFAAPTASSPPGATSLQLNGLAAGGTYSVVVRAMNEAKLEEKNSVEKTVKAQDDAKAPTFAGGKAAAPGSSGGALTLSWDPGTDDLTPAPALTYLVYLSGTQGGENLSAPDYVSAPGAKSITIKGLAKPNATYYAVVRARDAAGNVDANKAEISGKSGPDVAPPSFAGCTVATTKDASSVTVAWAPAIDDTTPAAQIGYDVYAAKLPGKQDFTTPTASFTGVALGLVTNLTQSTTYYFVCRARDASNNADTNTSERTATTLSDSTPPVFAGITAITNVTATGVDLNWAVATDDQTPKEELVYDVYEGTSSGGQDFGATPKASSNPGASSVTLSNLQPASTLYWVVRARDKAGNRDTNTIEKYVKTGASFALNVQPIFSQHCAVLGCHVPGNPPLGMVLSAGFAYSNIVNVNSGESQGAKRVLPGDAPNSFLFKKITGTQTAGELMPPASTQDVLTQTDKDIIESWITQGALNN
jgi:hypothetical protein